MKYQRFKIKDLRSKIFFSFIWLFGYLVIWLSNPSPVFAGEKPLGELKGLPGAYEPGAEEEGIEGPGTALSYIFRNTFGVLTIVAGLMFVLYFILGGLSWLSAGGKAEQVQKAKQQMTNAVIGLIIVVAAYGIAFIVGNVLGIHMLNPEEFLKKLSPGGQE